MSIGFDLPNTERVFYVIRNVHPYNAFSKVAPFGGFQSEPEYTVDDATQFPTFDAVVDAYAKRTRAHGLKYEIIKVTRTTTNSLPTRRVLGETEAAPEGAVVKYALQNPYTRNAEWFLPSVRSGTYTKGIDSAALFNSHELLMRDIVEAARSGKQGLQVALGTNIVRVAIEAGGTITNDVLTVLP